MIDFIIQQADFKDMDFFLSRAKEEGWNPGLQDSDPFYCCDPGGFFIGYLKGEKIGCVSAVAYDESFGFMGFFIVLPPYRKQGFGHRLWTHGMNYLGNRIIGLDGVLSQQRSYEKSHFQFYYKNQRLEGRVAGKLLSTELLSLKELSFETLLKYDLPIFGLQRAIFLQHWIEMPNAYSLAKVSQGQLRGYGVIRKCFKGYKIGPLFADHADVAVELFQGLCNAVEGDAPVYLDIPTINESAVQMAKIFALKPVFETVRMYNKTPPKQQLDKVFGVTTFELG